MFCLRCSCLSIGNILSVFHTCTRYLKLICISSYVIIVKFLFKRCLILRDTFTRTIFSVSTRLLLSSCPVIYWWVAMLTTPCTEYKLQGVNEIRWSMPTGKISASTEEKINAAMFLEANRQGPWWSNLAFDERGRLDNTGLWIQNYFMIYGLLGIILFSNYLPWT